MRDPHVFCPLGAIPALVQLLKKSNDVCKQNAISALANLAYDERNQVGAADLR